MDDSDEDVDLGRPRDLEQELATARGDMERMRQVPKNGFRPLILSMLDRLFRPLQHKAKMTTGSSATDGHPRGVTETPPRGWALQFPIPRGALGPWPLSSRC